MEEDGSELEEISEDEEKEEKEDFYQICWGYKT